MKFLRISSALFCAVLAASCAGNSQEEYSGLNLVPKPLSVTKNSSDYLCSALTLKVYAKDGSLKELAQVWAESLVKLHEPGITELPTGFTRIVSPVVLPQVLCVEKKSEADVKLTLKPGLAEEEYTLSISGKGIVISAGTTKGAWWALQSLSQLLIQAAASVEDEQLSLPGVLIQDKPHFAYRGAHFDPCRHFFTVDEVKSFIDIMALHKLNTLHWHLTEDQGWRLEIHKYPLLTEVGAIRRESKVGHYRDKAAGFDGTPYGEGCYYTHEDVKEVLEYATARQITVIPEIEMPGHAVAALAAYPHLGCTGGPYEVRTTWGISDDLFCMGKESTFEFLEGVLEEVCELFPSEYIHIGGDECPVVKWKNCPDCQALMQREGLSSERELQGYMLKRIESFLNDRGKKIIGWDEILDGGVTQTATVMSWRGPKGGIKAAGQGNDVIMTPNNYFYLDYYQTAAPKDNGEPAGIGGYVSLAKSYSFDPYDQLDEAAQKHIIGIQANTWTEYIASFDHMQHMDLPRFAALSEVAWSENKTDYEDFLARVDASLKSLYEYYGYIYAPYAFNGVE